MHCRDVVVYVFGQEVLALFVLVDFLFFRVFP